MANNQFNPYQPYGYPMINQPQMRYPVSINPYEPQYVTGIEGANAYQMPAGVQQMILWDTDKDCFYIKKLDEIGRPRVVAWKDFSDHVEPAQENQNGTDAQQTIDMSVYPTKKDLEDMLEKYNMTNYLTKDEFEKALGQLCVGERGRIVRNELDT